MRIAMLSTPFVPVPPPRYGGTELMIAELVQGLVQRGHDVTLFATGDSRPLAPLRWTLERAVWPPDPLTELDHVTWALREIARGDFDVIHAHSAAALACTRLGTLPPLVYTIHHAREEALTRFYSRFPHPYYVAISGDQARRERPLPRLRVIHHGLDPARFQCTERPGDYVCFVGRLAAVKGAHTAIDVARRAGTPIRVAGGVHPPDREYARRELAARLEQPHVTVLGEIGPEVKTPLLRDARALVAPIEWHEPFGLILIEAMLSGCPVVAFPRGSVPELIEPGVTGYIARSPDEMVELIRPGGPLDDFDRARCRAHAVQRFGRDRMAAAYEELYEVAADAGSPTFVAA